MHPTLKRPFSSVRIAGYALTTQDGDGEWIVGSVERRYAARPYGLSFFQQLVAVSIADLDRFPQKMISIVSTVMRPRYIAAERISMRIGDRETRDKMQCGDIRQ